MLPAILVVGLVAAGTYKVVDGISNALRKNREPEESEASASDVHVVGQILPELPQQDYFGEASRVRLPGEPLWENHRLFENLPRPQRIQPSPEYIQNLLRSADLHNRPEVNFDTRLWQNTNNPISEIPQALSIFDTDREQPHPQREDPFANGNANGWTYEGGSRQRF